MKFYLFAFILGSINSQVSEIIKEEVFVPDVIEPSKEDGMLYSGPEVMLQMKSLFAGF